MLADSDGSLGTPQINFNFDTAVEDLDVNLDDGCARGPGDPTAPLPIEGDGARAFNTPPMVGVTLTAPFFHDNSVETLQEAVEFYVTDAFLNSPAGQDMPTEIEMSFFDILDIVAFLEAISVDPRDCDDGIDNDGDGNIDLEDPRCVAAYMFREGCGLGFEAALIVPPLVWLGDRRRRRSPKQENTN